MYTLKIRMHTHFAGSNVIFYVYTSQHTPRCCAQAQVEVQDFGGYFQESRGPVTLRGLMECTKGEVELVMNGKHKRFVNSEQAMEYVTERFVLKSVSAKENRLVVELQQDILVPNDVKEDWVRSYEEESGEDISFF